MEIDWKKVSQCPGYKSLKAAYIKDAMAAGQHPNPMRKKPELYRHFQFAINRAKHYAHHLNCSIEDVLNDWEEKRDCWWLGYYTAHHRRKFHSDSIKPQGKAGLRKYYKRAYAHEPRILQRMLHRISTQEKRIRENGKKPRWSKQRKRRGF